MDPITAGMMGAAVISSAGSVGGSLLSGDMSKKAADKAARWQLYMSNTAHQRAVEDLRKAGLNPLLALHNPASTGQMPMPSIPDLGQALSTGVNSAVSASTQRMALKSAKLDLDAKKAMYKLMESSPVVKKLFLSGMMATSAGLPPTVFAPMFAVASASGVDRVWKVLKEARVRELPSELDFRKHYEDINERNAALRELFKNQR